MSIIRLILFVGVGGEAVKRENDAPLTNRESEN